MTWATCTLTATDTPSIRNRFIPPSVRAVRHWQRLGNGASWQGVFRIRTPAGRRCPAGLPDAREIPVSYLVHWLFRPERASSFSSLPARVRGANDDTKISGGWLLGDSGVRGRALRPDRSSAAGPGLASAAAGETRNPRCPSGPAPASRSRDDPRSTGRFCRGSARVSQPVLHRLPQREDEGRRARLVAASDDGRARSGQRGQGPRRSGSWSSARLRAGHDAAARREAARPGPVRRDDRLARERARSHGDAVHAAAGPASPEPHRIRERRPRPARPRDRSRRSTCRPTTRRPASTTSPARSASRRRSSRRTCRRRRRSAGSRWAIPRSRRSSSTARAKTRRRTITSKGCRSARAAACSCRTCSRPTASTRSR